MSTVPMQPPMQPTPEQIAALAAATQPQATPASAGFAAWAADPRNSSVVANSIVRAGQPILPPNAAQVGLEAQGQPTHGPADPTVQQPSQSAGPSALDSGALTPPAATPTGAAPSLPSYDQWAQANPHLVQPQHLANHPVLGAITGALLGAAGGLHGDPAAGVNWIGEQRALDRSALDQNVARYKATAIAPVQAQSVLDKNAATTDYTRQRPELQREVIAQRAQARDSQNRVTLAKNGQKYVEKTDPDTGETYHEIVDDRESQAFLDRQNLDTYRTAIADKAKITSELASNKFKPGTPEYADRVKRLQQTDAKIGVSAAALGIRKDEYMMHAFGKDGQGQELPGVLHDEAGNSVGSVQASNVRPTGTQRDAAGRADTMVDLGNRIRQQLADPEVASYLGPVRGRVSELQGTTGVLPPKIAQLQNDLVSYGAFQAGLHPVRGIGALHYFDKVMGGLGQTPEQLLGKLNSNDETAASVQQEGTVPTRAGQQRMRSAPTGASSRVPSTDKGKSDPLGIR